MNPDDPGTVRELAAQLIARRRDGPDDHAGNPEAIALERLSAELCRWVGEEGCRVLLGRALTSAQRGRPALADLRVGSGSPPLIEGVREGVETHGPAAMASGIEETIIGMLALLRRLIGGDLTFRIAERSVTGVAPNVNSSVEEGAPPHD